MKLKAEFMAQPNRSETGAGFVHPAYRPGHPPRLPVLLSFGLAALSLVALWAGSRFADLTHWLDAAAVLSFVGSVILGWRNRAAFLELLRGRVSDDLRRLYHRR